MQDEDFRACLRHGIANILVGRIVQFHLLASTKAKVPIKLLFWKQSPAGSLNDINNLIKSSIVSLILDGSFNIQTTPYTIDGTKRDWLYFLVDGIYPAYSIFISMFHHPQNDVEKYFATCQEACRKDIERAFGVLVQRFQILQRPLKNWYWNNIVDIMDTFIIMHNMIIKSRRVSYAVSEYLNTGRCW
jgi:hypothetical protein